MKTVLAFFLSGLTMAICQADPDSLRFHVQHFTDENGLPQNSIKAIGVDKVGYVWLATEAGLVRYDGRSFNVFDNHTLNLRTKRISVMYHIGLTDQLMAISGFDEEVEIARGSAFRPENRMRNATNLLPERVNPWPAVGVPTFYPQDSLDHYKVQVKQGDYIISHDSIVFYGHKDHVVSRHYFKHTDFHRFFPLNEQLFFLAPQGSLQRIDPKTGIADCEIIGDIIRDGKDLNKLRLFWNAAVRDAFIYVDRSLYHLQVLPDESTMHTQLILNEFDFDEHGIFTTYYDQRYKHVFLGSLTNGLYVFIRAQFKTQYAGRRGQESLFYAQLSHGDDLVLTSQGYVFADTGLMNHIPVIGEKAKLRYSMLRDKDGNIWTTRASSILTKFSPDGQTVIHETAFENPISRLYEGIDGCIWLGAYDDGVGVYRYDPTRDEYQRFPGIKGEVTWLHQPHQDTLFVGTNSSGLQLLHIPSGNIQSIPGLEQSDIRSIYQDDDSRLWITTYQDGFFLYYQGGLTSFPLGKHDYLASSHCMMEDGQGYFWISTNNGLFQVKRQSLLDYVANPQHPPYYIYHHKHQGFYTNEFNGGCQPCAVRLADGSFSFPSMNGLVRFNPEQVEPELPDSEIRIDEFEVDDITLPVMDTFQVAHGFERIKITVSTPYFGHIDNLFIEYQVHSSKLKEAQWFPLDGGNIFLHTLPSGLHEVTIRKTNIQIPGGYDYAHAYILVPPRFYESWWFISAILILLACTGWLLLKIRIRRLKRRNAHLKEKVNQQTGKLQEQIAALQITQQRLERETYLHKRLAASISHDVNSPLRFMGLSLKKIQIQLTQEQHSLTEAVTRVQSSTHEIYEYIKMLTDYSKTLLLGNEVAPSTIHLRTLVEDKINTFKEMALQKGVHIKNEIPQDLTIINRPQLLTIVLHNLIDNAIKFTIDDDVVLKSNITSSGVQMIIKDKGLGMSYVQVAKINAYNIPTAKTANEEISTQGLGLKIVKDLINLMGGTVVVRSMPRVGTSIVIELPVSYKGERV
ncbi:sensor histidine kinase [Parapedobacter tibetensis]|uniref:sensor histidine kinase n=1 Tax=Parapedobacter tibetensis TaxID=2972951 RepID=UPI00214DF06D|nr:two-component regulator propeller domain-containing protein [Parapedobacter tibetensis]